MNTLLILLIASTVLGAFFVAVAAPVVPPSLLNALVAGFAGFVAATILAARGKTAGYWLGLILSILVLMVSLPAPAHLLFITSRRLLESAIFIAGNAIQVIYITIFVRNILLRKQFSQYRQRLP